MASFLQKFIRGTAAAGSDLYADQARLELREKLLAEREAVLQKNRMGVEQKKQAYETQQSAAAAIAEKKELEEQRAYDEGRSDVKFGRDKELTSLRASSSTKTPSDVLKVKALVKSEAAKDEAEAWRMILGDDISTNSIFKSLDQGQDTGFGKLQKGEEGYMSVEDLITEAKRIKKSITNPVDVTPKPKDPKDHGKPDVDNIGSPKTITTQAEYDALEDGAVYYYNGKQAKKGH